MQKRPSSSEIRPEDSLGNSAIIAAVIAVKPSGAPKATVCRSSMRSPGKAAPAAATWAAAVSRSGTKPPSVTDSACRLANQE
ncbi:hypothetical protein D3C87_2049120 [compost metagenome]